MTPLGSRICQLGAILMMAAGLAWAAERPPLAKDGLHDPANPALKLLQDPRDALAKLPPDKVGNKVRWVQALDNGVITPRTNILPETKVNLLDLDVLMKQTGEMPMVLFPHRQHTAWLDCSNCHDDLFKAKAGGNPKMNMFQILDGKYCGQCHGAVAFPLTECKRCHSVVRK